MPSWDNVSIIGPPSLVPPVADFSALSQIPDAYYKGQQQARQVAIQNAFKGGLPKDAAGQTDYAAAANKLFELGDYGNAANLLKTGYLVNTLGQPTGNDADLFGGARPSVTAPTTPGPQRSPQTSDTAPTQPVRNYGGDNVTVGPAQDIPAGMSTADAIGNVQRTGQVVPGGAVAAPPQTGPAAADPNAPLVPRPVQTVPGQMVSPQPAPQRVAQSTAADTMLPEAYKGRPIDYVNDLTTRANKYLGVADQREAVGVKSDALREKASQMLGVAKQIRETLAPTPEQRNAIASGQASPLEYEAAQGERKTGAELYVGLQGARRSMADMKQHLDAMSSLGNDPNFYSGTAEGLNLFYKRAYVALGGDPNAALPQEALRKIVSANINNQLEQMKAVGKEIGGSSGRVFLSQVNLMQQAAQNPASTPAALRYLTELGYRAGEQINDRAALADRYKNGRLDNGFNPILAKYEASHPMFSAAEMKDMRLVAPPVFATPQAARAAGLKPGDVVRTPPKPGFPRGQAGYLQPERPQ